jgi:menaquinone-dependent protoporphyrinogen oxidase
MSTEPRLICDVPVFFATTEGQTQRIAERLAAVLREHGRDSRAIDLASPEARAIDWRRVSAAIVGASLHMGRHQRDARAFLTRNAVELNRVPSAFVSVSLSAASANPDETAAARQLAQAFPAAHHWTPSMVLSLAGRLAYTQYGFFTRQLMKRIARKEGAPTDTSRDYELTNWERVDRLADALDGMIHERSARRQLTVA